MPYHPQTLAVRAGTERHCGEHSDALFLTSSFVFSSAEEAQQVFAEQRSGYSYSRFANPTVASFEARMCALEGGERALATATGMAAITSVVLGQVQAGDHVICARDVFGSTYALFNSYFTHLGIAVTFVDLTDYAAWQAAITDKTKLFFLETPTNPLLAVADIAQLSAIAQSAGAVLVVDNCFASPILQTPLALGADFAVHSATKHIDGQGRCLGGVIICRDAEQGKVLHQFIRTAGLSMGAFAAWNFLKGLETLPMRIQAAQNHAAQVVDFLVQHPKVEQVNYPGLANHPSHALASQQMRGFGSVLSFAVKGGQREAWQVIDQTQLLSITANLGDTRSTITHPSTTTHGRLTEENRLAAGITQNLIRVAVGLEHPDDICADLARGLG